MKANFHESYAERPVALPSERSTGLVLAAASMVLAAVSWPATLPAAVAGAAAIGLAGLALVAPQRLSTVNRLWFGFSLLLNRFVSPLVMGALYYLVITPFGLLMQQRRDPLRRQRSNAPTYWVAPDTPAGRSMTNQF